MGSLTGGVTVGRSVRWAAMAAGMLFVTGVAATTAQAPSPSGVDDAVRVCVDLVGADAPIDPSALSPASLTSGIVDGTIRVVAIDGTCGGPAPSGEPQAIASPVALVLEARDLSFTPKELELPAGVPATLTLHNAGRVTHNLTIDGSGTQVVVSAGGTEQGTIGALPPGTYAFYCSVSGHRAAGMEGTLTVR